MERIKWPRLVAYDDVVTKLVTLHNKLQKEARHSEDFARLVVTDKEAFESAVARSGAYSNAASKVASLITEI